MALMIKLSQCDPNIVADEVSDWIDAQMFRLGLAIGVTDPIKPSHAGDITFSARVLTIYAQTGKPPGDAPVSDYVQSVVEVLYTAAHPDVYTSVHGDWEAKTDPRHAIDCVVRAALARERLDGPIPEPVPVAWLAALASLPVQTLRSYGSRGEIEITNGDVEPEEAKRWLSGRGVAGFGAPA